MDHAQIVKIGEYIEDGFSHECRHGGHADMVNQQGVAIGCSTRHFLRGNCAARTQSVFYHHGSAAQGFAQGLGHVTRQAVSGTPCSEGHHQGNGFVFDGKGLCQGRAHAQQP